MDSQELSNENEKLKNVNKRLLKLTKKLVEQNVALRVHNSGTDNVRRISDNKSDNIKGGRS